jgi:hypothetical protein
MTHVRVLIENQDKKSEALLRFKKSIKYSQKKARENLYFVKKNKN